MATQGTQKVLCFIAVETDHYCKDKKEILIDSLSECFQLTLFKLLDKEFGFTVLLSLSFLPCKCFVSIASSDGGKKTPWINWCERLAAKFYYFTITYGSLLAHTIVSPGIFAPLSKISKASDHKKSSVRSPSVRSSPLVKSKKIDVTHITSKVNSGECFLACWHRMETY